MTPPMLRARQRLLQAIARRAPELMAQLSAIAPDDCDSLRRVLMERSPNLGAQWIVDAAKNHSAISQAIGCVLDDVWEDGFDCKRVMVLPPQPPNWASPSQLLAHAQRRAEQEAEPALPVEKHFEYAARLMLGESVRSIDPKNRTNVKRCAEKVLDIAGVELGHFQA